MTTPASSSRQRARSTRTISSVTVESRPARQGHASNCAAVDAGCPQLRLRRTRPTRRDLVERKEARVREDALADRQALHLAARDCRGSGTRHSAKSALRYPPAHPQPPSAPAPSHPLTAMQERVADDCVGAVLQAQQPDRLRDTRLGSSCNGGCKRVLGDEAERLAHGQERRVLVELSDVLDELPQVDAAGAQLGGREAIVAHVATELPRESLHRPARHIV